MTCRPCSQSDRVRVDRARAATRRIPRGGTFDYASSNFNLSKSYWLLHAVLTIELDVQHCFSRLYNEALQAMVREMNEGI